MRFYDKLQKIAELMLSTVRRISKEVGIPPSTLYAQDDPERDIGARTALKLARFLNVPLEWLIDDEADFSELPAPRPQWYERYEGPGPDDARVAARKARQRAQQGKTQENSRAA